MKVVSRAILLLMAVTASLAGLGPAADQSAADKSRANEHAIDALKRMAVPLQRDPLGHVRWIEATHGELDDDALHQLPGLPMLEWLEIGGGDVTPAGVAHLKDCPGLRRLYLHDLKLGGDSLIWLSGLRRLEALSLQRTGISGDGLKHLNSAGTLKTLNLSGNGITDRDLDLIARMTHLEVLALRDTKVTGSGLAKLKGMPKLNVLNLTSCRITDIDLENFLSMENLRIVFAAGCDLTDQAIKDINAKLPLLSIFQ